MYAARHFSTITHPRQSSSSQSHGNTIAHSDSSSHVIPERSQYPTINSSFGIFIRLFPFPAIRYRYCTIRISGISPQPAQLLLFAYTLHQASTWRQAGRAAGWDRTIRHPIPVGGLSRSATPAFLFPLPFRLGTYDES